MKKPGFHIGWILALFILLGCSFIQSLMGGASGGKASTPTPLPTNTPTPSPTATVVPPTSTLTPTLTNTPKPTKVPKVTVSQLERALRDAGYTPYRSSDGSATIWVLDNVFETTTTHKNGIVEMQVLNSLKSRLSHMEKKFEVMDGLFPSEFMSKLREANKAYDATVGAGVTGKPDETHGPDPGDIMQFQWAYYNVSEQEIESYRVLFALLFMQWTCPPDYICSFPNFGNQQFTGQASFVFYEVAIWLDT